MALFYFGVDSMKEWAKGFYQSGAWRNKKVL